MIQLAEARIENLESTNGDLEAKIKDMESEVMSSSIMNRRCL